jgi:5'-deoxynucleotidase
MSEKTQAPVSSFCAYLSRLKHIQRWSLMRNNDEENVMEHSWMVSVIAHGLAVIYNTSNEQPLDVGSVVLKALYHDVTEVMTGDLPTPVKYHSPKMKDAYGELENLAAQRLLMQIPSHFRSQYQEIFQHSEDDLVSMIVKSADRISAWIKCVEERRTGNMEFQQAETILKNGIDGIPLDCVKSWMNMYAPAFEMSLDDLGTLEHP